MIVFAASVQDIEYVLHNSRENRSQAQEICSKKYNGFLPYSDNFYDYGKLKEFMKVNNIRKSWLGLQKQTFSTPHWINSSVVCEYDV